MKNIIKSTLIVFVLLSVVLMSSCGAFERISESKETYTVTFNYGDERESETFYYTSGDTVARNRPTREGYEFVGWCTDRTLTDFYDFSSPIANNVNLYAKWSIDYKDLMSRVSSEVSSAVLEIYSVGAFGTTSQGSGVIYKESGYCYHVLTNNHVVTKDNGKPSNQIYAYDVYGNLYEAQLLKSDANYDLAILSIYVNESRALDVVELGDGIPEHNERLATVSVPDGKINTVDIADVVYYQKVEAETDSNVLQSNISFEVLWLDGNVKNGSSGGAVFNSDLELVGIIYGGLKLNKDKFSYVLVVPIDKVIEFIGEDFK